MMNISFFENELNLENNIRFQNTSFSEEDLSIRDNPGFHFDDYGQIKLFQKPKRENIFLSNPPKTIEDNNFNLNFSYEKTTLVTSKIPRFETKIIKKILGRKRLNESRTDINDISNKNKNHNNKNDDKILHDKYREDNGMLKIKLNTMWPIATSASTSKCWRSK